MNSLQDHFVAVNLQYNLNFHLYFTISTVILSLICFAAIFSFFNTSTSTHFYRYMISVHKQIYQLFIRYLNCLSPCAKQTLGIRNDDVT